MAKIKYGFGKRLKRFREIWGYSQSELAKKLGLQPSTISHFESEGRMPSYKNLFIIGRRMGWDINALMGFEDSKQIEIDTAKLDGKLSRIADILNED